MKRITIVLLAMVFALGMVFSAQASNIVNCKTTSEAITKVGCEKAGSMSFTFDAQSTITEGDWWYADLPVGVTICQPINFEIVDGAPNTPFGTQAPTNGESIIKGDGCVVIKDIGAQTGNQGITATGAGVLFKVTGQVGSQRILITVIGRTAAVDAITVDGDAELTIKILDQTTNIAAPQAFMFEDTDGDGTYGDDIPADVMESADNTFCINAEQLAGNYVNVSYDSLNDKFTFTGDNEVAHVMAANTITLGACKGDTIGYVPISGGQNAVCSFDYENPTNYCTGFAGNQVNILGANPFDAGDYRLRVTITAPATGVYFGAAFTASAFTAAQDVCTDAGTALPLGTVAAYLADGTTAVTSYNAGTCTVASASRAIVLESSVFTLTVAQAYNQIYVNLPAFVYDSSVVQSGQTVTVQVELLKDPCGTIFSGTRDVAIFTDSCTATPAVGNGRIVLPYFPAMDVNAAGGWAWGFALYNNTAAAGSAAITVYEMDGDSGTMTQDVGARGLVILQAADLLAGLTPAAANTGNLGDAACFVQIDCDWASGAGSLDEAGAFGMLWDGVQAQGMNVEANY